MASKTKKRGVKRPGGPSVAVTTTVMEDGRIPEVVDASSAFPTKRMGGISSVRSAAEKDGRVVYRNAPSYEGGTRLQYAIGFLLASIFSLSYYVVSGWLIAALVLAFVYPSWEVTWYIVGPVVLSAILPIIPAPRLLKTRMFSYIPMYFQYKEVMEASHEELQKLVEERPTIFCMHPHGVFSMVALCAATTWVHRWWSPATTPTAAADSVVRIPLLKHIVGLLGLTSASAKPLARTLRSETNRGCVLYPGGTAEMFLTDSEEERLFILNRKGFIKIALMEGCALVPGYLFGNTRVLRLFRSPYLKSISRRTGFALTYLYGRFCLPMPLPEPCMCAVGKPILFPKIENPTSEDIDKWHAIYVSELVRVFDTYKVEAPGYEHKTLQLE